MKLAFVLLLPLFLHTDSVVAEITPARVISDHMVLQQQAAVPVWGRADPGQEVTVKFAGQTVTGKADVKGEWRISLKPMAASDKGTELIIRGGRDEVRIKDVLVGEVWYASGQSNMWYPMSSVASKWPFAKEELAAADFPGIRFCHVNRKGESNLRWEVSSPSVTASFAATAFFFARKLHRELGVPVAIIDGSSPAKPIEPFIPEEALRDMPRLNSLLEGWIGRNDMQVGDLHRGLAEPVIPYGIKGFIWYQGESNTASPVDYAMKMEGLIKGWRSKWGNDQLPFYWVQLSSISVKNNGWPYLREEQRLAMKVPKTGMAVIADLDGSGIHPLNKIDVGERLARWALAKQYGKPIPCSGPLFKKATIEGNRVRVTFDHAEGGLMTGDKDGHLPVKETPDIQATMLQIADADHKWHDANTVTIDGSTLVVSSKAVAKPIAVRYAYSPATNGCNLYGKNGLPVAPFVSKPEIRDPNEIFIAPEEHAVHVAKAAYKAAAKAAFGKYRRTLEYQALNERAAEMRKVYEDFFVARFPEVANQRSGAGRSRSIKRAVSKLTSDDVEMHKNLQQEDEEAAGAAAAWLLKHDDTMRHAKNALDAALKAAN